MDTFKKIVLAGGTGQLGTALAEHFKDHTQQIIVLSRSHEGTNGNIRTVKWDGKTAGNWYKELEGADILVNLAGKNVNCRYTEKNKKEIFDSRTHSVEALAAAVEKCAQKPALWVQCASATIYRHAEDRAMTERDGETGEGFSVEVCKKWEGSFNERTKAFTGMRKAILRTSLVLGKKEGVFPRLKNLVKFGLGGKQGDGKQMVSWVHEKDVARMVEWLATHPEISGPVNCTAPLPLRNKEFMRVIRQVYGMPIGMPAPAFVLELGAFIIRTETELILKSRWAVPEKLLQSGFRFQYPDLQSAVKEILDK